MPAKDTNKMKRERQQKIEEARAILDSVEKREDKKFTIEEEKQHRSLILEIEKRTLEIQEETILQNDELRGETTTEDNFSELNPKKREVQTMNIPENKRFRNMFPSIRGNDGFKNKEEFFEILVSGRADDRMQSRAAKVGTGHLGGFSVPSETSAILWDRSLENSIVRPRAQIWPMMSSERKVPAFDSQDTSENVYGFVGRWVGELQESDIQDPLMRVINLQARKLAIFTALSREVHADGLGFSEQLEIALIRALAHYQDVAFINGSGVGEPMGIINAKCTLDVERTADNAINYADVVSMYSKLIPGGAAGAIWLISQSAIPQLATMVDPAGNLIWRPGEKLLGLDVEVSEKVPSLGSRADLTLADFSFYSIGQRAEIAIDTTNAHAWVNDRLDVRAIIRVDGQPIFSKPIKNATGLETSPFVVLK